MFGAPALGVGVDVVRIAVARRSVAALPPASAVADRKGDALSRGEQTLFPAHIEWIAERVDRHCRRARAADVLFSDGCGQCKEAVFAVGGDDLVVVPATHLNDPHARLPRAEHGLGVGQ